MTQPRPRGPEVELCACSPTAQACPHGGWCCLRRVVCAGEAAQRMHLGHGAHLAAARLRGRAMFVTGDPAGATACLQLGALEGGQAHQRVHGDCGGVAQNVATSDIIGFTANSAENNLSAVCVAQLKI